MQIHADLSKRAIVHARDLQWTPSPLAGVERKMLERDGEEVARATSMVRYEAGSSFDAHQHGGGEEFLVLDGVFSDEHGDYPAGTYVRNPPGSEHTPRSDDGCLLFVKLRQMSDEESERTVVATAGLPFSDAGPGIEEAEVFAGHGERVTILRLAEEAEIELPADGGEEIFVLDGVVSADGEMLSEHDWLRTPTGQPVTLQAMKASRLYRKSGHLSGT